jgi:C-terminal processing protease CtpA/Prc
MYRITIGLFIIAFCSCGTTARETKDKTPREYLDEVFKIVEQHSIKRDSLDFEKIRRDAYAKLNNAISIADCYPIVRFVLSELNDHHSFFMEKEDVDKWTSTSKMTNLTHSSPYSGKVLINEIGFIEMEGFSSGDSISILEYANDLQKLIKSIDNRNIKGWILDLRQNTGGNCWPMLAGIGPLLGNGVCGYFIGNDHNKSSWYYRDGIAGVDSVEICKVNNAPYNLINSNNPIAILTGPRTTSSGDVIVTSFRGKKNAKSFGESTGGLSTGNASYTLSDGSMIFLTTSIYADRMGTAYGEKIIPDNFVQFEYEKLNTDNDPVIKRAIEWIQGNK